jgi:hypothetical protein
MSILLQVDLHEISKEYLDAYSTLVSAQSKFWTWLLLGLGLQVLSSLSSLIIQWRLKNLDKNITKFNLREERRIKVYEEVYRQMVGLTWFVPGDSVQQLNQDIFTLDNYSQIQNLYIDSDIKDVLVEYLDHFRSVSATPHLKNIAEESRLLEKYYQLFNS